MLFAVGAADASRLLQALRERNIPATEIGSVIEKISPLIQIT